MQEKDHIKDLFSETFRNYEVPVRPELWNQLSNKLAKSPNPAPEPSGVAEVNSTISQISGATLSWIAGAVIVVSTSVGIYFYSTDANEKTQNPESEQIISPESQNSDLINNDISIPAPGSPMESGQQNTTTLHGQQSQTPGSSTAGHPSQNAVISAPSPSGPTIPSIKTDENQAQIPSSGGQKASVGAESSDASNPKTNPSDLSGGARLQAEPLSGTAPLTVSFHKNGETARSELIFGDGTTGIFTGKTDHVYTTPGTYEVTLNSIDLNGQKTTEKITIRVTANLTLANIPNWFTPNHDGYNDTFTFEAGQFSDIEVNIYDKSGKFICKFTDPQMGWDGKLNTGKEAEEGIYLYVIFATSFDKQKHMQKGMVTLSR